MRFLTCLILLLTCCTCQASISSRVNQVLHKHAPYLNIGILVQSAKTGNTLFYRNPRRYYHPASNTKIFTAVAALSSLGTNFKFATTASSRHKPVNGKINGNLYLKFTGDPSLKAKDIKALLQQLHTQGIKQITGNVLLDTTTFSGPQTALGLAVDDLAYCYAAPVSSIIINQNCSYLTLFRKGNKAVPAATDNLPIDASGEVELVHSSRPKTCVFSVSHPGGNKVHFSGCLPYKQSYGFPIAIPDPEQYAQKLIASQLANAQIKLNGQVKIGPTPEHTHLLASHKSRNLATLSSIMLQTSNNTYAEALTKTLGQKHYSVGSFKAGVNAINATLQQHISGFTSPYLEDGAGASTYNLTTPRQIAQVLYFAYHSNIKSAFIRALPVAGESGTLAHRLKAPGIKGHVFAKTGSMSGTSSLSGYILRPGHTPLVFVILINGIKGSLHNARHIQDLLVHAIARG